MWVLYCQFAVDKMEVFEEGVEFVRGVFERAVTACGQHVTKVIKLLMIALVIVVAYRGALFGMHIVSLRLQC